MKLILSTMLAMVLMLTAGMVSTSAQNAEPLRISFAKGKSSATKTGTLSDGEEMDFVFGARAGQTVSLSVTSAPKGRYHDFTLMGDGFEFQTELDSYFDYSFTAPETGDYLVTVRKRAAEGVTTAKFYLVLSIR